jgi:hypothetical protein
MSGRIGTLTDILAVVFYVIQCIHEGQYFPNSKQRVSTDGGSGDSGNSSGKTNRRPCRLGKNRSPRQTDATVHDGYYGCHKRQEMVGKKACPPYRTRNCNLNLKDDHIYLNTQHRHLETQIVSVKNLRTHL